MTTGHDQVFGHVAVYVAVARCCCCCWTCVCVSSKRLVLFLVCKNIRNDRRRRIIIRNPNLL
jgi:hypothetical protein